MDIILLQLCNGYYFVYKPFNSEPQVLQYEGAIENASSHPEDDSTRSRTPDPHEELPHLPMPQDETHKLPLSRRTNPATRPATNRPKTHYQHPSRSNQEILRHVRRTEVP